MNISTFRKAGLLKFGIEEFGTFTMESEFRQNTVIEFNLNTLDEDPYLELMYSGKTYTIYFSQVPSTLGKGEVWYFLCLITQKQCRILYLINGLFVHREAFPNCYYENQVSSKKWRELDRNISNIKKADKSIDELEDNWGYRFYSGKPTKRYARLKRIVEESQHLSLDINPLLIIHSTFPE